MLLFCFFKGNITCIVFRPNATFIIVEKVQVNVVIVIMSYIHSQKMKMKTLQNENQTGSFLTKDLGYRFPKFLYIFYLPELSTENVTPFLVLLTNPHMFSLALAFLVPQARPQWTPSTLQEYLELHCCRNLSRVLKCLYFFGCGSWLSVCVLGSSMHDHVYFSLLKIYFFWHLNSKLQCIFV